MSYAAGQTDPEARVANATLDYADYYVNTFR